MDLKVFARTIDDASIEQIDTIMQHPIYKNSKVRIMPDCHAGAGCVIGFTSTIDDGIVPNLVGVDIGCGVSAQNIGDVDVDLKELDNVIARVVPSGFNVHKEIPCDYNTSFISNLKCRKYLVNVDRLHKSMGTLGGGNHFISLDVAPDGDKWLIVHSGSRNLGLQVAEYYQGVAIEYCKSKTGDRYKVADSLAFLEGEDAEDYLHDMNLCQMFAAKNRWTMIKNISEEMGFTRKDFVESVHNYIDTEYRIIRKGAIAARKGEDVIIPLNMRDGCVIGVGKGNEDWNNSAPHGAGRVMGRKKALREISMDDFQKSMVGIYTTTAVESTKDEAPMVYKPSEEIIELLEPTVKMYYQTKPIYNFKAVN